MKKINPTALKKGGLFVSTYLYYTEKNQFAMWPKARKVC